jgi:hypothetical protein
VADDDHLVATARERGSNVVDGRSGCEALVGLGLDLERPGELAAGLPCSQQRAREDRRRPGALGPKAASERTCLLTPLAGQLPKLVRLSGLGFGVADEVEAHRG